MLEKSIGAMLSAIEIYNKPDFKYREETFSVLCINSWELLFKAKLLNLANNKVASLYAMGVRVLKSGKKSTIKRVKKNRSGNPMSIGLLDAYRIVNEEYGVKIDKAVNDNLIALTEIRDNSIHFVNNDLLLCTKIQELGSASLQNYLNLVTAWYGNVLSGYNFYLMPLSFFRDFDEAPGVALNAREKKVLEYIKKSEEPYDGNDKLGHYNLTLRIDVKFQKVKSSSGIPVHLTKEITNPGVVLIEADFSDKYPWDYDVLCTRLSKSFSDFKINSKFYKIKAELVKDKKFAYERLLNPKNPKGSKKVFYNSSILKEFEKHYTLNTQQSILLEETQKLSDSQNQESI